jgi:hypothetical protein
MKRESMPLIRAKRDYYFWLFDNAHRTRSAV